MKPKFKLIMNLCLSSLFLLTSCKSNYLDEFYYIQDNVTNQEYKIGDEEAFDKISKDTNYELEDYVSYKMFRSKDDLNYYYFNNENKLYRFLTYDTDSSIFEWQIGTSNNDKFYEYINSKTFTYFYSNILSGYDDLYLPDSNLDGYWGLWACCFYSDNYKDNFFLGFYKSDYLLGFFIQYV